MYTIEISYCEFIIIRHTPIFMDFLDKTHQFSIAGVIIQFSFKPRKFGTTNLNEFTIIISFHLQRIASHFTTLVRNSGRWHTKYTFK
jgi:hypothetical protein